MYAGLSTEKADYYAVMDADLQDPPAMLPDMYAALQDGYDMAGALAHVKPAAVYMHGPEVGDLIDDRIDRLHTLDILPY